MLLFRSKAYLPHQSPISTQLPSPPTLGARVLSPLPLQTLPPICPRRQPSSPPPEEQPAASTLNPTQQYTTTATSSGTSAMHTSAATDPPSGFQRELLPAAVESMVKIARLK